MKKKILMILGIGVMLSYSCQKDKLNPVSLIYTSSSVSFSTATRIQQQVLGLYNGLRNGNLYGGRFQDYGDIKADNWVNLSTNAVTGLQTWNETVTSTNQEVIGLWAQCYLVINNCNLFIDGMAGGGTAVVGTTLATQYIAEAKYLRALSYWSLLQYYARPWFDGNGSKPAVPLRLTGNQSYTDYGAPKATTAQVYAQIIKDLNDAETGLPKTYTDATTNTTRVHMNSAIALKTRVYLTMQDYANVIAEANKIVSTSAPFTATNGGVAFALQADITKVFASPYNTTESIFSMPFNSTETGASQSVATYYFYNNGSAGSAEYYLNPTGIIANTGWKATDKRRSFVALSTVAAYKASGYQFLPKYTLNPYTDWMPVMRYSEVLLNLAEAITLSTKTVDARAVALLSAVRSRSDATTTYTPASFAAYTDLETSILTERNIEFLGEGLRFIDLERNGLTIPAKSNIAAVPASSPNYIWPISNNELIYNSQIGGSNN
jgi:starch-binding outer membrane protein, SusD/RagB family